MSIKPFKPWPFFSVAALAAATTLLLAALLPRLFAHWQACRAYPFQLDAEEGFILNQALTLARGGSIYASLAHPPFLVGNYPPLLPWFYSRLSGTRATLASLPDGRALVQAAALLAALALGAVAALRTRRLLPALLAPLLFAGSYEVYHWAAFVRVDLPAVLLTVAGLGVFLTVRPRWGLAVAAVFFVAAGFTRQTALLAPAACAAALLIHDRRRLAWFLIPYAGLGLVVFGLLQARTGGEFFRHVVTYNQNKMDWAGFASVMKNEVWFFYRGWILALAWGALAAVGPVCRAWREFRCARATKRAASPEAVCGGSELRRFAELPHTRHAVTIYLLLAALSLLSYAKVGAAPNYVLEPLAAAALWSAERLGRLLDRLESAWDNTRAESRTADNGPRTTAEYDLPHARRRKWGAAAGAWGFCLLLAAHGGLMVSRAGLLAPPQERFAWSPEPAPADRAAGGELLKILREAPGDVFCEEPVFTLLAGKPVLFQPFIMAQLAREGRWEERPVLDWIRARRFSLFAATADLSAGGAHDYERYTPAQAEALRQSYTPAGRLIFPGLGKQYFLWKAK